MLKPCSSCARLVRHGESSCPFCAAAVTSVPPVRVVNRHMSRAARIAAVAALTVACGGGTEPTSDAGGTDSSTKDAAKDAVEETPIGPMYGGPFDASVQDATADASDASADAKQDVPILPPYGQAPMPPDGWV